MANIVRPRRVSSTVGERGSRPQSRAAARAPHSTAENGRSLARSHDLAPSVKELAKVAVATLLVAACPITIVWWLRASGTVSTALFGLVLGMAMSLCASYIGCRVWEKRAVSDDLLFSELMIWGFLHRWRSQRRLASALDMLGPMSAAQRYTPNGLSTKEQAKLLERLVAGIETRDPYLNGHSRRVARHAWMIAKRMGVPRAQVARIRTAAAIHDVGKIKTPKTILHKAGPLTVEEYEVIKRHPGDGARMAGVLRDRELMSMIRHHHERLDGTGYPSGLRGEEIPLGARIIAVADTFDAITSPRAYRPASSHRDAIEILRSEAGTQLDPAAVRAFCSHYAGRRPLALWSSLAGLPERVVSWLGGSVTSVVPATKVIAIAALVGGAAATTSTLAMPLSKHPLTNAQSASRGRPQTQGGHSRLGIASAGTATAPGSRPVHHRRHVAVNSSAHAESSTLQPTRSSGGVAVEAQPSQPASTGGGPSRVETRGEGKSEEPRGKGKPEEPRHKGKPEEPRGSGKQEEPHSSGKPEELHGKGKPEELHGKGNPEEPHGKGKPEEPHTPAKGEEPVARSEAVNGKSDESHGKAK
jgi:HD-GYP domain-containing protein (c-di-GMP phosphodiesterase class II)